MKQFMCIDASGLACIDVGRIYDGEVALSGWIKIGASHYRPWRFEEVAFPPQPPPASVVEGKWEPRVGDRVEYFKHDELVCYPVGKIGIVAGIGEFRTYVNFDKFGQSIATTSLRPADRKETGEAGVVEMQTGGMTQADLDQVLGKNDKPIDPRWLFAAEGVCGKCGRSANVSSAKVCLECHVVPALKTELESMIEAENALFRFGSVAGHEEDYRAFVEE